MSELLGLEVSQEWCVFHLEFSHLKKGNEAAVLALWELALLLSKPGVIHSWSCCYHAGEDVV